MHSWESCAKKSCNTSFSHSSPFFSATPGRAAQQSGSRVTAPKCCLAAYEREASQRQVRAAAPRLVRDTRWRPFIDTVRFMFQVQRRRSARSVSGGETSELPGPHSFFERPSDDWLRRGADTWNGPADIRHARFGEDTRVGRARSNWHTGIGTLHSATHCHCPTFFLSLTHGLMCLNRPRVCLPCAACWVSLSGDFVAPRYSSSGPTPRTRSSALILSLGACNPLRK